MNSPAQDVVPALFTFGLLCLCIALVLRRHRTRLAEARHAFEMGLLEQLAQPGDRMSQVEAPSQSALQAKDGQVGITAGAALSAHDSECISAPNRTLRNTEAKGAQTL